MHIELERNKDILEVWGATVCKKNFKVEFH